MGLAQLHPSFEDRSLESNDSLEPVVDAGSVRPTVTVVLPTLNERSLHPRLLSIRCSRRTTPTWSRSWCATAGRPTALARSSSPRASPVRLLDNTGVTAAAGMNLGITLGDGRRHLPRRRAHAVRAATTSVAASRCWCATGAANVGGRMRPVGTTTVRPRGRGGHVVAARRRSRPVPLRRRARRTSTPSTSAAGGARRSSRSAATTSPRLQWAAEDHELNFRLRRRGGRDRCSTRRSAPGTSRGRRRWPLARQYFNYGLAQGVDARQAPHACRRGGRWRRRSSWPRRSRASSTSRGWRRWIAAGRPRRGVLGGGARPRRPRHLALRRIAPSSALEVCHWSYGVGFWAGRRPHRHGDDRSTAAPRPIGEPAPVTRSTRRVSR